MKVSHRQQRQRWQSSNLRPYWTEPGYLYATDTSFEFVPDRLSRFRTGREIATYPYPQSLPFSRIETIDHAVPSGPRFVGAKYPLVRMRMVDESIEWFGAHECIAQEASALLNGFLQKQGE